MLRNVANKLLQALGAALAGLTRAPGNRNGSEQAAWEFATEVMRTYHFTRDAQEWVRTNINLRVDDLASTNGGGYWQPALREVRLFTAQHEAAVHELAHAWWHDRRDPLKDDMIEAVIRLSKETDPRFQATTKLAYDYVHGIPAQNWAGMLVERNDWEMFAGLASGTMGDMRKLPSYVRRLYEGLFEMPQE